MIRALFLCFLGLITCSTTYSQTVTFNNDTLLDKLELYSRVNPSNLLFVHTDKTLYTNNETIWFSAYLIESGKTYSQKHTILSVAMVREDNREVILQDQYLMKDGLSFGSMGLPDSIPPGNYRFIASTNALDKNGHPLAVFTQPLTIKSITFNNFTAALSLLDSVVTGGAVRARVTVTLKDPDPKSKTKPGIAYSVGKGEKQTAVFKQNESSYIMTIPAAQLSQANPVLLTSVTYNKEVQYLSVKLPEIKSSGIHIRFFPEGGNLTEGMESVVGWETRTSNDVPVALRGILYRGNVPADTISTNTYGIGSFKLKPDGSSYTLKVTENNYLSRDTVYTLPGAMKEGIILHLADAVVNDTLQISLFSRSPRDVQVLIHNYRKAFALVVVQAKPIGTKVTVALPALPKGVSTVTILDDTGRPLAERLFFAHYDRKITAAIQTDKAAYNRKEKVSVKLKLTDQDGKPVQGIISVAVVQDNRIESSKQQDIESYVYLNHDLGNLPKDPSGRGFDNKDYLEDILLVKGWRRFTWQNLIDAKVQDTLTIQTPQITGRVKYNNKPLKKPIDFSVMRDSLFELLTTAADGSFIIHENQLLTTEGRKVLASVNEKNKIGYTIETDNPFIEINQVLADQFEIQNTGFVPVGENTTDQQLKGMERMIALQEVVVKGNNNELLYGRKGPKGSNNCGDYVDEWGYLNYLPSAGSASNTQPIKGQRYRIRTDIKGDGPGQNTVFKVQSIVYSGCITVQPKNTFSIEEIYMAKEFYGVDSESAKLSEPQYISTLFWKPGVVINTNGEAQISFISGDITGKFRIVVQGAGATDIVSGGSSFMVK